jgi:predicted ATPase/class 3 adenylate cyclase
LTIGSATAGISGVSARPSGTITFLFTDIEDSTRLWDHHPNEMREALARHDRILQESIDAHAGYVFSRGGDGVAAAFGRAGDAIAAAVDAQRALQAAAPWPPELELRVRMGMHTGEAEERDGDYLGPPVNRAARLMSAAHGGQIVLTSTTADMVWPAPAVELLDLGILTLRGITNPVHVFGIRTDGVPWVNRELRTASTPLGNLPRPVNEWFGPVAELRRRVAELTGRRLVTLTGTGGVGKTRLALEMAAMAAEAFHDGVWMAELAPLSDPGSVALAVATTLSIQPHGATVVESIIEWLRGRRLLLLLDNCEHVLTATGELAAAIVASCPTVTVLATSREPLGADGERVVPVAGLDPSDAVALFCDRALAVDDTLQFSDRDSTVVAEICEELDGIPLAIELAAARLLSLTPSELLERLADRLRILRAAGRPASARHWTLEATVAWSYQLLPPSERLLFDRLSVFAGDFELAAAEAICASPPLTSSDVFELLTSLVRKSMVTVERGDERTRYRLLETLRQFALERLEEHAVLGAERDRHLRYYVAVAERANDLWASRRQLEGDGILEREWDNVRAAHAWAITRLDVDAASRLVAATGRHARARGRQEHGDWAERTLGLVVTGSHPYSSTYAWAARAAVARGDYDAGLGFAQNGIGAAPSPDHPDAAACWGWVIKVHVSAGRGSGTAEPARHLAAIEPRLSEPVARWAAITELIESGLANDRGAVPKLVDRLSALATQIGAPSILSETARYRALSALYAQEPRDARAAFAACQEGLALARSVHDLAAESINLSALAFAVTALHTPDAGHICRDAIIRLYDLRFWNVLWLVIETAAGSLAGAGRRDEAAVVYGHLEAHRPPWGIPGVRRARERGLDRIRDVPQRDELMARGAVMDRDQLVAYVVDLLAHGSGAEDARGTGEAVPPGAPTERA